MAASVLDEAAAAVVALSAGGELNHSGGDWWAGVAEEDAVRSLPLDGDGGLWSATFVPPPPPPRPDFLDEQASPDGLTTCDLCSWAWHDGAALTPTDAVHENPSDLGWLVTLAIVSVLSAAIGAVLMVTVLQCRSRLKNLGTAGVCSLCIGRSPRRPQPPPPPAGTATTPQRGREGAKDLRTVLDDGDGGGGGGRVWTWLTGRRSNTGPSQLGSPALAAPAENHYTLDEAYTAVGEALYAELERDAGGDGAGGGSSCGGGSPAYQNTAYNGSDTEPDAAVSSAPSSAYYSDLSCATAPDRTYEAVGMVITGVVGQWDAGEMAPRRHPGPRLAAITETITVPSDYV